MAWTKITDQDEASSLLPSWIGRRLVGLHGRFGLLLTTGDVLRITTIAAVLTSSDGHILLDVALDHAGIPEGVDLAWQTKHFLGAPYPGADEATVNLQQVVTMVEFAASVQVEPPGDEAVPRSDEIIAELERLTEVPRDPVTDPSTPGEAALEA